MRARLTGFALLALLSFGCGGNSKNNNSFSDSDGSGGASTDSGGSSGESGGASSTDGTNTSASTSQNTGGSSGDSTSGMGGSGGDASTGGNAGSGGDQGSGGSGGSGGDAATGGSGGASGGSGGTGGDAATGGSGGSGGGSGGTGGTTGTTGGPITVTESCDAPSCGGDLEDTSWAYTGICVEEGAIMDPLVELCADVELVEATGHVEGTIDFLTNTFEQDASVELEATILVPASCGHAGNCILIEAGAAGQGLTGVDCTNVDGDCECVAPLGGMVTTNGNYSTSSSTLTLAGQDHEYCAEDGTLRFEGTAQGIPFVYEASSE